MRIEIVNGRGRTPILPPIVPLPTNVPLKSARNLPRGKTIASRPPLKISEPIAPREQVAPRRTAKTGTLFWIGFMRHSYLAGVGTKFRRKNRK